MTTLNIVGQLREEIAEKDAEIDRLRKMLVGEFEPPTEWKLTPSERAVMKLLVRWPLASREKIIIATRSAFNSKPDVDLKMVDVLICKLRKRLKNFDIQIGCVWGQGYYLEGGDAKRVELQRLHNSAAPLKVAA